MNLRDAFESLAGRRVVLFGGKGGVGKTTISVAAALRFSEKKRTILFTTDPASNLSDIFGPEASRKTPAILLESLDAAALYDRFLGENLDSFLELGDRGTYLDREELRHFFELSLPGIDELMAWSRIGELAETNPDANIVVDTAPTGHTLRMLGAAEHFRELSAALDAMQQKHRAMVQQLTRRRTRDAMDAFIERFEAQAAQRRAMLNDAKQSAFVPVMLSDPWVVEQTQRLLAGVRSDGLDVPFVILNRAIANSDCERDRALQERDAIARRTIGSVATIDAPRACAPLDTAERIREWLVRSSVSAPAGGRITKRKSSSPRSESLAPSSGARATTKTLRIARLTFFAGKGGVGKTTCSVSLALQLAARHPGEKTVVLSVDPAHALRDAFAGEAPPKNLAVEIVDTRTRWRGFRETIGEEIQRAVDAVTPGSLKVAYDADAMQRLVEIAPPGADEIFAITRLSALLEDESVRHIVVDTAPTGHFLRLLDLPRTAGEWVREFMRILLRYRELIPPGSLGEELIRASRAFTALQETLASDRTSLIVVTRPERIVIAETKRLIDEIERRGIPLGGVIANYMTPENDCACDRSLRSFEIEALRALGRKVVVVERRDAPVALLRDLAQLLRFAT